MKPNLLILKGVSKTEIRWLFEEFTKLYKSKLKFVVSKVGVFGELMVVVVLIDG